jgi:hypothetical protein
MANYIVPASGQQYPDITGGQLQQTNGDPVFPGTVLTGPVIAGNVVASDGTNTLAGLGAQAGTANQGFCHMTQACVVNQATNTGTAGQFACPIVIPAQSQITSMKLRVTTAFSGGATTLGIGSSASATAFTAASAVATAGALGDVAITPGTGATQIANWDNVGNQDVQIVLQSTNTGAGVATLIVEYVQGINLAS